MRDASGVVYLLHFEPAYKHARHYLGWTSRADLTARLIEHTTGRGARLIEVAHNAGVVATLARTWTGGRGYERELKRRKASPRLCPLCNPRALHRASVGNFLPGHLSPTVMQCEPPF